MIAPIYPMYVRDASGNIMYESATGTPIYDDGSTSTNSTRAFMGQARPGASIANDRYTDINTTFNGQWYAHISPVKGLTFSANLALTEANDRINALFSRWGGSNETTDGSAAVQHLRVSGINTQFLANYELTFAKKNYIHILAGYEAYRLKTQDIDGSNDHLYNPFVGELDNAGGTANKSVGSYTDNYMTQGFLSRLQYNYDEKYYLTASYRRDASSRFHPDHRWGNFGSVGAAWLMTKENFMSGASGWLDMLKFKASWGVQGNDNLLNYYPYMDQYSVTYSETTGEYSKTLYYKGNEDITWETSYSFNTGFDFSLWTGRLDGTVEYFNRKTVDLLYNQPVPLSSGITTGYVPTNVGSILNQGVELELYGVLVRSKNVEWGINFNLTHYTNRILDLDDSVEAEGIKGSSSIYRVGGSLYQAYLKRYAGVDRQTGEALYYVDPDNGDWSVTSNYEEAQQADCGSTLAKVYGGFGTTLNFYGFDFSVQMSYQLGGRIYDGTYQALMHTGVSSMAGTNWSVDIRNAWTPDNVDTDVPRLDASDDSYQLDSDRFLVSSNYLSINNVTLGYSFPARWLKKASIAGLRVYVTGDNLWVFSARRGLDPRAYLGNGSSISSGNYTYSAMRNISGGISITF